MRRRPRRVPGIVWSVRIKQYVYFSLDSEHISGQAMAEKIGLAADHVDVRGSKISGPRPKPLFHSWEIVCDSAGLTVDEQTARVLDRLRPYQQAIRDCVAADGCSAVLMIVRYFGAWLHDDEGDEEEITVTEDGLEKLPGQHQLLGWHLSTGVLEFLLDVGAEIYADEYG